MAQSPLDPERIAEATARRLLERATALDVDGPTLAQLRQAAEEAGISAGAFDTAVAEWRAEHRLIGRARTRVRWTDAVLRNVSAFALGWLSVAILTIPQRFVAVPWLVHKLTDPLGLAVGAVIAARLRGRMATIFLGGLAVSQGAEFLMDLFSGGPAVHGFGAHIALMIAGVAGVSVGRLLWRRSSGPRDQAIAFSADPISDGPEDDSPKSPGVGLTNAEADKRFLKLLRLRRSFYFARLQLT
jgi:hypothetical protein